MGASQQTPLQMLWNALQQFSLLSLSFWPLALSWLSSEAAGIGAGFARGRHWNSLSAGREMETENENRGRKKQKEQVKHLLFLRGNALAASHNEIPIWHLWKTVEGIPCSHAIPLYC